MEISKIIAWCSFVEVKDSLMKCLDLAKQCDTHVELIVYRNALMNKVKVDISKKSNVDSLLNYIGKTLNK